MDLSLTNEAREYINGRIVESDKYSSIVIYQYNKHSCSGSWIDYIVDLDKEEDLIKDDIHDKWKELELSPEKRINVYLEKGLWESHKRDGDLAIDLRVDEKFNQKLYTLFLVEEISLT